MSQTGYVVKYVGCLLIWVSKLQSTIALLTTEAKYMALSAAMQEVIYIKNLMDKLKAHNVQIIDKKSVMKLLTHKSSTKSFKTKSKD